MRLVRLDAKSAGRLFASGPLDGDDLADAFGALGDQLAQGEDPVILSLEQADLIASSVLFWLGRGDGRLPARLGPHPAEAYEAVLALDRARTAARADAG